MLVDTSTGEILGSEKKEEKERIFTHTGTCRFCGQVGMFDSGNEHEDQHVVDEEVTLRCTCQGAMNYKDWMNTVEEAKENLNRLTENVRRDIKDAAMTGIDLIGTGTIQEMQMKMGRKTLKVQKKAKGAILVQMTENIKNALET